MIPFSMTQPMSAEQIGAATQAMLRVARVDAACTEEEIALIRAFYDACRADAPMPAFETVLDKPSGAAVAFADVDQREFVVAASVMVAYADGKLTDAERGAVHDIGREIGVTDERIGEIVGVVQDHLLSQLSGLPDSGAVVKVAREFVN